VTTKINPVTTKIKKLHPIALCALAFGLLILPAPSFAHHGIAAFQEAKEITVTGSVTYFDFVNPHALIYLNVRQGDGSSAKWEGELTSPNILARVGWTRRSLRMGEQVTLTGYPAKNGASSMWIRRVVKSDGTELPIGLGEK
jgi:hypothetical protein